MYTLKQHPEDFVVNEIPQNLSIDDGPYAYVKLTKKDYNTQKALDIVASHCHKRIREIGFAGNKDRQAITTQYISIKFVGKEVIESFSHPDIQLEYLGQLNHPISLGNLEGNEFQIMLRDVQKKPTPQRTFYNFYGEQRFSTDNAQIGKLLLQQKFKEAYELLLQTKLIKEEISNADYVRAISTVPQKILTLLVNSYQSYLWNESVKRAVEKYGDKLPSNEMPLVGFESELENSPYKDIIEELLREEGMNQRSFIVPSLKQLSVGGSFREIIADVKDFYLKKIDDETYKITFTLGKGSYATEVVRQLF